MRVNIAVAVDPNGSTTSLYEPGRIVVYRKEQGTWRVAQEFVYDLEQDKGVRHMRQKIDEVVRFLAAESQVFVGLSVIGIPYFEIEKAGLSIWEFEGNPEEFLDYIITKEEEAQLERDQIQPVAIPEPQETAPGHYAISLKEIQENHSGVTTKQVLLPFLQKGAFNNLEILCNHVPPWLEAMAMGKNYDYLKEQINSKEVKVNLAKKN
ncbi:nitrogenase [bacterium BFN5]|nr:nitrogenase [bacterium BFN5]QJW47220.1 nitrogenase [bacterium BFN5]